MLALVDIQPAFMNGIWEAERVLRRSEFLARSARLLDIPVFATEQYPERMGGTDPALLELISEPVESKMTFSCLACEGLLGRVKTLEKPHVILCGIETHICVTQTAIPLVEMGCEVFVCADAVSARTEDRHQIGLDRMRAAGAHIVHTESIVYEWMNSAQHPKFRDILKLVKEFA